MGKRARDFRISFFTTSSTVLMKLMLVEIDIIGYFRRIPMKLCWQSRKSQNNDQWSWKLWQHINHEKYVNWNEMKCELCFDVCLDLPSLTQIQENQDFIHECMGYVILESMIWFDLIWFDLIWFD